jgi:hypothetical protein
MPPTLQNRKLTDLSSHLRLVGGGLRVATMHIDWKATSRSDTESGLLSCKFDISEMFHLLGSSDYFGSRIEDEDFKNRWLTS